MRWFVIRGCLAALVGGFCLLGLNAGSTDAPADREALRYDGKPFEYWRSYMRTELKAERRIDAFRALAAFGVRGHPQSAAAAIVDAVKDYGEDAYGGDAEHPPTPEQKLIRTATEAIVKIGPAAFEVVLRNANDANVRRFATEVYSHSFKDKRVNVLSPSAVQTLLDYLQGGDIEIRRFSVGLLEKAINDYPPSKANILAVLRAKKDTARLARAVIEILDAEDFCSINGVLETMGSQAKEAVAAMVRARLSGGYIRDETFIAVGAEAKDMLPGITEGLKSKDAIVRTRAADWLGRMGRGAKPALPALLQALQDNPKPASSSKESSEPSPFPERPSSEEYEKARVAVITALGQIGAEPRKVVPALAEIVSNDKEMRSCRLSAANALSKLGSGSKAVAPVLLKVFANDGEPDEIRSAALSAIEQIGLDPPQVIPPLIEGIKRCKERHDKNDYAADHLTAQSIIYLAKLRPQAQEALPLLLWAFKRFDHPPELKLRIPQALGEMGPAARDALPALREEAKSRSAAVRKAVAAAIAKIEGKEQK